MYSISYATARATPHDTVYYCSYEDYLDNQITATDMFYLEDVELARHLVELGLKVENMEAYFERKKRLTPKASDLSFYNWETQMSTSNPTPNFQVIADNEAGLLFKNKRDRKVINVDPRAKPGDNSTRTELATSEYMQVVNCVSQLHHTC
ncbi:hypothetical protein QJQ45_000518 [Haematococcus lacustris]|nr:hypothetical protein QJQ45_000518 [Haematococcus lacustris]